MDAKALEGKRGGLKEKVANHDDIVEDDLEDDMEEEEGGFGIGGRGRGAFVDDHGQKKGATGMVYGKRGTNGSDGNSGGMSPPSCQVEKCGADLSDAKRYHRRHKVCEVHSKAPVVVVAGLRQRFCQQCSRFHELTEFDEVKRSCRRRLAGHNERRRKSSVESYAEGSSRKGAIGTHLKEGQYKPEERGRLQMTLPGNSGFKRPQIR